MGSLHLTITRQFKYSAAGVPLWTNRYNGPVNGTDQIRRQCRGGRRGNVYRDRIFIGWQCFEDYATIKYSGAGVPLWTNRYNGPANGTDDATAVALDRTGNVFVTGTIVWQRRNYDYATIKYSRAGVPLWTNRYNGPGNGDDLPTPWQWTAAATYS